MTSTRVPPTEIVPASASHYYSLPHLALAAGGPNIDGAGLIARYELLQDIARELAAESHEKATERLAQASGDTDDLKRVADYIFTRHE